MPSPKAPQELKLNPSNLDRMLIGLEMEDQRGTSTLYLPPRSAQKATGALGIDAEEAAQELTPFLSRLAGSPTGAVVFWGPAWRLAVLPPLPVEQDVLLPGTDASLLRHQFTAGYHIGVVLLRLGRYAVGVFHGNDLVSSKTGGRYVKSTHSAGGTSQKRFQRIRENQIHHLYQKTCTVIKEHIGPFDDKIDWLFLGGEKFTLQGLVKGCNYLQGCSNRIVDRTLNVREPKESTLKQVINTIYESQVLVIR